jgi:DNA-binding NtrC family response regulator
MAPRGKVLIVDDDESMRMACEQALEQHQFAITLAADGAQALDAAGRESFDVALLDLKMPGMPGMEVLRRLKQISPGLTVIIITGYPGIESAVEAIKQGAYDYLPKPFTPEVLTAMVLRAMRTARASLEYACVKEGLDGQMLSDVLIGRSEAMNNVLRLIRRAAPMDSTILITGETGVGKEVVARAVHRLSRRASKPFVTVDCGTLVESLFESELFGHVKGAFSGAVESTTGKIELASGGTLFLDEIGNINTQMQASLLRMAQEREICRIGSTQKKKVDVRIIAATNRELMEEVRAGRFREDLYYRLNVVHITVPPLRDRVEDIPPLVDYYLKKLAHDKRRQPMTLSDTAMRFLKVRNWPGNVRELINAVEYAVVTTEGGVIQPHDFPYGEDDAELGAAMDSGRLARVEREEIFRAVEKFHGNQTKAAEFLGINRKTLREKLQRYAADAAD